MVMVIFNYFIVKYKLLNKYRIMNKEILKSFLKSITGNDIMQTNNGNYDCVDKFMLSDKYKELTSVKNYCIEVDRVGIGEENLTMHQQFTGLPTREEIIKFLESEDIGYDDDYCKFDCYPVN